MRLALTRDRAGGVREEKNCAAWFKTQIEARLCGAEADMPAEEGWARITAVKELKGDVRAPPRARCASRAHARRRASTAALAHAALRCSTRQRRRLTRARAARCVQASLSTRKGNKKVAVYDLVLTLEWSGHDTASDTHAKGELKLSEFASANDEDEFVCAVTVEGKGAPQEALRKRVATLRAAVVRDLLAVAQEMLLQ